MKIAGGAAGELTPNVLLGGKADMAVALRSIRSLAIWLFDDGGDSIAVQVLPPGSQRSSNVKVFLEFLAAKVTSKNVCFGEKQSIHSTALRSARERSCVRSPAA